MTRHFPSPFGASIALGLLLAGCVASGTPPPDTGAGNACYSKDMIPAVVQVVTEQELVKPAERGPDGSIVTPAVFRTTTHQEIISPRKEVVLQVPCPEVLTPEFITSLQRALAARGLYPGRITGQMDKATRRAIRLYQMRAGLNSDVLTLETARELGLVAYGREGAGP